MLSSVSHMSRQTDQLAAPFRSADNRLETPPALSSGQSCVRTGESSQWSAPEPLRFCRPDPAAFADSALRVIAAIQSVYSVSSVVSPLRCPRPGFPRRVRSRGLQLPLRILRVLRGEFPSVYSVYSVVSPSLSAPRFSPPREVTRPTTSPSRSSCPSW